MLELYYFGFNVFKSDNIDDFTIFYDPSEDLWVVVNDEIVARGDKLLINGEIVREIFYSLLKE